MRVAIGSKQYDSVFDAWLDHDVTIGHIYCMISRGRADMIGSGRGGSGDPSGINAKPFRIGIVTYPSMADASRALGKRDRYIQDVMRRKTKKGMKRLLDEMKALEAKQCSG